ncbi:hypothetical protein ACS0TY_009693 [Phlomoides rotata]
MLAPRESDIPFFLLVFVFVPLVSYFLLGKWSEITKRREEISSIASEAAEEVQPVNDMAVGSIAPVMPLSNTGIHQCARCLRPATTRCSKCKSVWYCSGRCQIVHWRLVHKFECQQMGEDFQRSSFQQISPEGSHGRVSYVEATEQLASNYNMQQEIIDIASSGDVVSPPLTTLSNSDESLFNPSEEVAVNGFTLPDSSQPPEDAYLKERDFSLSEHNADSHVSMNGDDDPRGALPESDVVERECLNAFDGENSYGILNPSTTAISGTNVLETLMDLRIGEGDYSSPRIIPSPDATKGSNCASERTSTKRSGKSRIMAQSNGAELQQHPVSRMNVSIEPLPSDTDIQIQTAEDSRIAALNDGIVLQENNMVANISMTNSTKVECHQQLMDSTIKKRKMKMIFPYQEFVKCFQYDGFNVTPNGLVNCGNSCYANAVLQCLICTKPLIIYLLSQSHSNAGCAKDWCLICELEALVIALKQTGGPLSPLNILVYLRGLNSQIGDGSQEDAHEFLRLLLASMQSIYLEGYGGENVVAPKLQDTTFVQHTFGGCLRSKVKCMNCHNESERDEKIMDLTLEIYGRVESLEDALTQFTSPEDLDGDNLYRCAWCATYVQAQKQLKIKEAPNVLTIVLKRFQEGSYGKINKSITFPEFLDMIPFMTGTDDMPPLYMLYGVVVHLDMSNASFSGHYISYVKDLQDNWYKVDDSEVEPVELEHVLSQGAYILFYMRSYPRPIRGKGKATRLQTAGSSKHGQRSSRREESSSNSNPGEAPLDHADICKAILIRESRSRPSEFSDAPSSDWSYFTSSDDSSFTTDSTRNSFSTDHADVPFSSAFQSLYPAESTSRRAVSCSNGQTRFARQDSGLVQSATPTTGFLNSGSEARTGPPQTPVN